MGSIMLKKKDLQKKLDKLRRNKRAYQRGTHEYEERIRLEQQIDNHLYAKDN